MSSNSIGKIEVMPVRQAFRHEALDFTVWLEQNIEALSDRLGIRLTFIEREKYVGDFKVDLLCQDSHERRVIIENQLEKTDHDHLGKVLTYLVNLDAHVAIWITTEPRLEHENVINWLNENIGEDKAFYLVRIEAIRISDSPFAPLFTVLAQPDSQLSEFGVTKKELTTKELAERHYLRRDFWTLLLEKSRARTRLFGNRSPGTAHWLETGIGVTGLTLAYVVRKDNASVELYIDTADAERNKRIFDMLTQEREQIEQEFGALLDWQRLDHRRASRITYHLHSGNLFERDTWSLLQDEMIDAMIRLEQAFIKRVKNPRNV